MLLFVLSWKDKEIKVSDCPLGDTYPLRPELSTWEYTDHLHLPEEGMQVVSALKTHYGFNL